MTNTIPNVPRELLDRASNLAFQTQHYPLHEELRTLLSAPSPAGVDVLEVVAYRKPYMSSTDFMPHEPWCNDGISSEWEPLCRLPDAHAIIDGLRGEVERLHMQVVACGVVALANTIESAGKARQMHPDYMSASCSDVADAVDREIALRTERDQQAQRIGELDGLLREFAVGISKREMPTEQELNSWFDRIDAALSVGKESE